MFGQSQSQGGGFGFGTAAGTQAAGFGSAAAGGGRGGFGAAPSEVKWGAAARQQQGAPHHAASGATVFGQQPQPGRDSTGRGGGNAGRGRGGSAGQQQAWGRGGAQRQQSPQQRRPQQQQQQQQHQAVPPAGTARSAPILSRLGSIGSGVGERLGFWGGGSGSSSKADAAPAAGRGRGAPTPARGGRSGRQGPQLSSGRGASSWTRSASQQQQQQQVAVAGPQGRGGRSLRGLRGGGRLGARGAAAAQTAPGRGVSSQGTAAAQGLAASSVWGQSGGEGGAAGAPTWAGNDMADMEADDDAGDGDGAWGHEPDGDGDWEQQQDADGDEEAEEEEQEEEEQEPVEEEEEEQDGGGVMGLDQLDEGGGGADRGTATSPVLSTAQLRAARSAAAAAMAHGSAAPTGAAGALSQPEASAAAAPRPFRAPGGAVGAQQQQHLLVTPRCEDMCPQAERAQRTADRQLHEYERLPGDTYATSAALAVKKYTRSEAGGLPDPNLLRTWPALQRTLSHLRGLLRRAAGAGTAAAPGGESLLEAHRFLWDRYRGLRKDVTQTGLAHKGPEQLAWVIAANEEIARFMLLADALLAGRDKVNTASKTARAAAAARTAGPRITFDLEQFERDAEAAAAEGGTAGFGLGGGGGSFEPDPYDGHLNHQELTKTLLDLSALYREARRTGVHCPCEAEFLSYYLLLSRSTFGSFRGSTSNVVRLLNQMEPDVLASPHVVYALAVSGCLAATNWSTLLRLLEGGPLLLAAAAQVYVPRARSQALVAMMRTSPPMRGSTGPIKALSLSVYTDALRFDDDGQARAFVERHTEAGGLSASWTAGPDGDLQLELPLQHLRSLAELREPTRHCLPWLLAKAGAAGLDELVSAPCPPPDLGALGLGLGRGGGAAALLRPPQRIRPVAPQTVRGQAAPSIAPRPVAAKLAPTQATVPARPAPAAMSAGAIDAAAATAAATARPPRSRGQQQQQQQQSFWNQADNGSSRSLPSSQQPPHHAPSPASAGAASRAGGESSTQAAAAAAAAVFGTTPAVPPAAAAAVLAAPPSPPLSAPAWARQPPSMPVQPQHQQSYAPTSAALQAQAAQAQAAQAAAVAAAIAAEQGRAAVAAAAATAALAQRDAEIARLRRSEAELRLLKQERELRAKCDDAARRLVFTRWVGAAAAVRAAREQRTREDAALAAADATLGRRGGGSSGSGAGKRSLPAASVGGSPSMTRGDKRQRGSNDEHDAALADTAPAPAAELLASVVKAAAGHGTADHSATTAAASAATGASLRLPPGLQGGSAGLCCPEAGPVLRLLLLSGWDGTSQPGGTQGPGTLRLRRLAAWVRCKLTPRLPPRLPPGAAPGAALVAMGGSCDGQEGGGRAPVRTWAQIAAGAPVAAAAAAAEGAVPRRVWRLCAGAELLLSKNVPLPGSAGRAMAVEVLDVDGRALADGDALAARSGVVDGARASCLDGVAGLLLLLSGPDGAELVSAISRLAAVLKLLAPAPAVPLLVLAASGPDTQQQLEAALAGLLAEMPPSLSQRLSGARVLCAGPGAAPGRTLADALAALAESVPKLPRMSLVPVSGLLSALVALRLPAALAAHPDDVLGAHVAAHNAALDWAAELLLGAKQSDAGGWGYPPRVPAGGGGSVQLAALATTALKRLRLPHPPPLPGPGPPAVVQQQQQQALLQRLRGYLSALTSAPAVLHAGAVLALLAQRTALLPPGSSSAERVAAVAAALEAAARELLVLLAQELLPEGSVALPSELVEWLAALHTSAAQDAPAERMRALSLGAPATGHGEPRPTKPPSPAGIDPAGIHPWGGHSSPPPVTPIRHTQRDTSVIAGPPVTPEQRPDVLLAVAAEQRQAATSIAASLGIKLPRWLS